MGLGSECVEQVAVTPKGKRSDVPTYEKIKRNALLSNSVTINSVSIAGEAVAGLFSIIVMLKTLRLHMENDTYHPFLFHYMVGVSVGAVCICLMLNSMFLYETRGKKLALEYLDALYDFVDFDTMRGLFFDADGTSPLDIRVNPWVIFRNLFIDGSLCSRKSLEGLLIGNHPRFKFDNRRQYFVSKEYKTWLDDREGRLFNVFIVCYSAQQTKMVTFTGNLNRFRNGINFISYKLLSHSNLIHAIICSSDIPLLYPVESVDGTNFATDGASAERNQSCYVQSLINCSYYFSASKLYGRLLAFLGVTTANNNFLVIHNKINLQQTFEDLEEYDISFVPLFRSIQTLSTFFRRVYYNATMNVPLMSLFLQQPYIRQFSTLNINDIVLTSYEHRRDILMDNMDVLKKVTFRTRIPLFREGKMTKAYNKFNVVTSNQLISTFLYALNPPEEIVLVDENESPLPDDPTIDLHICYFDMNVRNLYPLDPFLAVYLLFGHKPKHIVDNIANVKKMGVVSGCMLYDINQRQGRATFDKSLLQDDGSPFMDGLYTLGKCVLDPAYDLFLGQSQS